MFEISFGEILLIGLVALIVLGPERLPTVARTIGALVGRAQRFVASVKSDIQQQSNMAGFDDLKRDVQDAANAFRQQVETEVAEVRQVSHQIEQAGQQLKDETGQLLHETAQHIIPPEADAVPPVVNDNQLDLFDVVPVTEANTNPAVKVRE